jgi:hypothetical protein
MTDYVSGDEANPATDKNDGYQITSPSEIFPKSTLLPEDSAVWASLGTLIIAVLFLVS